MTKLKMKILIVEDEVIIAADLMQILAANGYAVAGPAVDYPAARALLVRESPDLVLLDINLRGEKNGIDLAALLHQDYHLPFIFTSAFSDAATMKRAGATQPAAYLVKPFREEQLLASITVALSNFTHRQGPVEPEENDYLLLKEAIFIKEKKSFFKIQIDDILWLKAADNYVEVNLGQHKYLVRSTLSGFVDKLNRPDFIKTHKSYVINARHLSSIHPTEVSLQNNSIPLAKPYVRSLMEKLQKI